MDRILVVDDQRSIRRALEKFLVGLGYEVIIAEDGEQAAGIVEKENIDLVMLDLIMPKMGGVDLIKHLKKVDPHIVSIVMTAFGTITSAIEATKAGAYHYITKPFDLNDVAALIEKGLEHRKLVDENRELKKQLSSQCRFENIIGASTQMDALFNLVEKVADSDSTVLILGESGTGKELIARAIHFHSARSDRSLVTVNCGAIPEDLLESELFGHMKGSFTGAVANKAGRFLVADKGSIFLDEIGDMSPKLQVKLLRVLQERKFEPVGSTVTQEVNVRIIAATNKNLEIAVKEGHFREDLFYRLNVIPIRIPPLRERPTDIPLLVVHFINQTNKKNQRSVEGVTDEAMNLLTQHEWTGNVRELENVIERLVVLKGSGKIDVSDLPPAFQAKNGNGSVCSAQIPDHRVSFREAVSNFENKLIMQALEKTDWNKNKAAALLQLNRTTLVEKMKKKGIEKQ